jgi:hypothetical protein
VRERPDGQRVADGAHPDGSAEQPARAEHAQFDGRPDDADRVTAGGEPGHEAVARPGSEAGADVEARRDAVRDDASAQEDGTSPHRSWRGYHRQGRFDGEPHHDDVAHGADSRTLT